uniref:Hypoxia up-regulated protein 1 n=1 Tax=Trichuris muris TaxID=70415 RepID=A0A5S6QG80_TRIMR
MAVTVSVSSLSLFASLLFYLLFPLTGAHFAAMSVDLGSQYFKIGLIKPGVPMQIALNKDSSRKTPTIVAIKDKELKYGDEAVAQRRRLPASAYTFCLDLLGKKFSNPVVHEFLRRFPFYELGQDESRGTVMFKNKEEEKGYDPEQLLAMILKEARVHAEAFAEQQVTDAVISVPAFFNQAERRAMVTAAEIAGLNLISLMNDNTAAGLNYGMFRRSEFNSTPTTVLIYDMGASKTSASIFEYVMVEDKKTKEKNPEMTALGFGYDRYLGGLEFSLRLRDKLAQVFAASHATTVPIANDHRAMMKLLDEAERVKKILSTNIDAHAQAESVHEGKDFRTAITRAEFEELCADLFDRIEAPIRQALKMADISIEQIDHVILMGAATRVPKVQQKLQEIFKTKELGRYLNADEAIAMGAIYYAAHKIKGYRVKKFLIKDANFYPIEVFFASEKSDKQQSAAQSKLLRRTLYSLGSPYPQKKMITFNKHTHDFDVVLNYGDLKHLSQHQLQSFGSANITRVDLFKVAEALKNHSEAESVFKGVRVHFNMDDSGILSVVGAEAIFHKAPPPPVEESTLSKIGQKISSFFGGPDSGKDSNHTVISEIVGNQTVEAPQNASTSNDTGKDAAEHDRTQNNAVTTENVKPIVVKVPLGVEYAAMDIAHVTPEWINESIARLKHFEDTRLQRQEKEKAVNELESFLFETSDKLEQQEYANLVNGTEKEYIQSTLSSVRDWMDEQGSNTNAEKYAEQLSILKNVTKDLFYRHKEQMDRPNAVNLLKELMNYSSVFLENSERLLADKILTEVELKTLGSLLNETETWFTETEAKQNQTATYENPVLTVDSLMEKGALLDREVRYLLNKLKIHQQKAAHPPEARPDNYTSSSNDTSTVEPTDDQQVRNVTDKVEQEAQKGEQTEEETEPGKADAKQAATKHPEL